MCVVSCVGDQWCRRGTGGYAEGLIMAEITIETVMAFTLGLLCVVVIFKACDWGV